MGYPPLNICAKAYKQNKFQLIFKCLSSIFFYSILLTVLVNPPKKTNMFYQYKNIWRFPPIIWRHPTSQQPFSPTHRGVCTVVQMAQRGIRYPTASFFVQGRRIVNATTMGGRGFETHSPNPSSM